MSRPKTSPLAHPMHRRALAATLALLALAGPAAAQPDRLREKFVARLNAGGNASLFALPVGVWEVMDSVVLRELRRGRTVDEVNRVIAGFPGYSGPSEGHGVTIGRGTFYRELPRELPGYVVLPVRAGGETLLMGVYNFGINAAGRVSLFARRAGTWRRTGVVDARFPVVPYLLPMADSGLAMVTLETFTGGDHQDGTVRIWRLERGTPVLRDSLTGEMLEPRARSAGGTVQIFFTRFPKHLSTGVLGTRIEHYVTLTARGAQIAQSRSIGNPWVEVVDRYYANPAAARALLADPALARPLGTRVPMAYDDAGDLRAGSGWLVIENGEKRYRVTSRLGPAGWRIVSVEPK